MNLLVLLNVGGADVDCTAVKIGAMEEPLSSCKKNMTKIRKRALGGVPAHGYSPTPAITYWVNMSQFLDLRLRMSSVNVNTFLTLT